LLYKVMPKEKELIIDTIKENQKGEDEIIFS
jgi:hypothetical protein